jgi:hypothetical protein
MMKEGSSSTLTTTEEEEEEVVSGGRNGSHRMLKDKNWRYLCGCGIFLRVTISRILPWATACFRFWVRSKSAPAAWQNNDGGNYFCRRLRMRASRASKVRAILFGWRGHSPSRKLLSTMAMTVPTPQSTTSTNSSNNPSSKQMSPHDETPTSQSQASLAMNEEAEFEVVSNMKWKGKKWACLCLEPTLTLTLT